MKVKQLKEYKDKLNDAASRDLAEFEKNFLLIASGLLAFSVSFIKDIIHLNEAEILLVLFISWFFLIVSIGSMMYAFIQSSNYSDLIWAKADKFLLKINKIDNDDDLSEQEALEIKKKMNRILSDSKKKLKKIRYTSIYLFLIGLLSLCCFIGYNLILNKFQIKKETPTILRIPSSSCPNSINTSKSGDNSIQINNIINEKHTNIKEKPRKNKSCDSLGESQSGAKCSNHCDGHAPNSGRQCSCFCSCKTEFIFKGNSKDSI